MKKETGKETLNKIGQVSGEITWTILSIIARIPEALLGSFIDHKNIDGHGFLADQLIDNLRSMDKRGYIELKKIDGSYSVRLTTRGKIKNLENPKNSESDGKIRIISYDIPEEHCKRRHQFCRTLRRIGYKKLQKSLWVCRFNKADEIDLVVDELGIREYVSYFIVDKSNVDDHIKKLF
ncbi:MAG: hypothetical protein NTY30_01865 [Candidatus Berkelbacteria bacterium]|nr:hypothetical protein [Candidatus Berkelbacteria bacterium]